MADRFDWVKIRIQMRDGAKWIVIVSLGVESRGNDPCDTVDVIRSDRKAPARYHRIYINPVVSPRRKCRGGGDPPK